VTVLFVVGPPGVGKTTLVRRLLNTPSTLIESPKWTVGEDVCAAGHYSGGTFDGADTVPYNGVQLALAYWESCLTDRSLTIFDGDRFSHAGTIAWFNARGVEPVCLALTAPDDALAARRAARGSKQNPSWMKGRVTKAARFADSFPTPRVLRLDAGNSTESLEVSLREWLAR
jgi:hypothetical protein